MAKASLREIGSWQWFGYGKHPSFPDYFSLGEPAALADAYKNWAVGGFAAFVQASSGKLLDCSYHFWSKGLGQDGFAHGYLQTSGDSLGRPYFLLIIGMASVAGWQSRWSKMSEVLGRQWQQIEAVVQGSYQTPSEMLTALTQIPGAVVTGSPTEKPCPNAWFSGGCGQKRQDFRFDRPLSRDDFFSLWAGTDEL